MKLNNAVTLSFTYLKTKYNMEASLIGDSKNYRVYKVRLMQLTYFLVNEYSEWLFIADLQPCNKLKNQIIKTIKAGRPLKHCKQA